MAINLGGIFQSGGKTIVSGGSSNLDTEALIKSLTELKRLPAVRLESTIEANTGKIGALNELNSILQNFRDAANFLRNPPGIANQDAGIFNYRSAIVSANTGGGSNYLSVTAGAGAEPSSYSLTVDQLATRQTRVTNTFAATDLSASVVGGGGPFNAGTLKLGASETEITLEDGDSLRDVLSKINAVKGESGVEATAVKVSEGNYRITLKSTQTGTDQNFDFDALNPGILNGGFSSEVDAVDALVTIDGTQITRQTNSISDLVDGLTFHLQQPTPPGTNLSVGVQADTELAKQAIMNFVDAYNAFRVFAAQQTETTDQGERVEGAILGTNTALRTLVSTVGSEISAMVNGLAGNNTLASIGLKLSDFAGDAETPYTRNILQVDEAVLDAALAADFDGVRKIFEFNAVSDNPNLVVFSRTNGLRASEITFNIDQTNGVYEATVNGNVIALETTSLSGGGLSLTGPKGSVIEGLNVLYVSPDDAVVNLQLSQGIGDRLYNAMQDALNEDRGIVAQEISSLNERNARLQSDIERIDMMVETFRVSLLEKFSAMEAAIASVNSILQLLNAQADARAAAARG